MTSAHSALILIALYIYHTLCVVKGKDAAAAAAALAAQQTAAAQNAGAYTTAAMASIAACCRVLKVMGVQLQSNLPSDR